MSRALALELVGAYGEERDRLRNLERRADELYDADLDYDLDQVWNGILRLIARLEELILEGGGGELGELEAAPA